MATKPKKKTYTITAKIMVETGIEVSADTLEDALAQARALGPLDFVTLHGEHNDSSLDIQGVWTF